MPNTNVQELPRTRPGVDTAQFDGYVDRTSGQVTQLAAQLGMLEQEVAALEALREHAERIVLAAEAAAPAARDASRKDRAGQVVNGFEAAVRQAVRERAQAAASRAQEA